MFGMGIWEFLVILVLGVMLIGPEQMPKVARTIGKIITQFKRATSDLRDSVSKEMHHFEEMEDIKEFKKSLEEDALNAGNTARDYLEKEIGKEEAELKDVWGQTISKPALGDPGVLESPVALAKEPVTPAKESAKSSPAKAKPGASSASAKAGKKTTVAVATRAGGGKSGTPRRKSPSKKATT